MEGKSLEDTWKKRKLDKEATKAKPKAGVPGTFQKVQIPYKDTDSQALILEVNASAVTATPLLNPTPSSFAGIASICADTFMDVTSMESLELEG